MYLNIAIVAVLACVMAGCAAPMKKSKYEINREIMIGSPAAYRYQVDLCTKSLSNGSFEAASVLRVAGAPPAVVCERFMAAVRDGRVSYEMYAQGFSWDHASPERVRILRGE